MSVRGTDLPEAGRMEVFRRERMAWLREAARLAARNDLGHQRYCQGRAAALNDVIVAIGGEGINLSLTQFAEPSSQVSTINNQFKD